MLNVNDLVNCLLVSKRFNKIAKCERLWYLLFKEKFYNCVISKKFYENYKKYNILNNFLLQNNGVNVNVIIRELYLSYNQLQSIPKEIGLLTMLQILYLDINLKNTIFVNNGTEIFYSS